MRCNKKTAKMICGIIVVAMIAGILYLTLQSPQQTTALSEKARIWLKNLGWEMASKELRSNVHIPVFFLLGLAVFLFGFVMDWKWYVALLLALCVALLDEGIKVFLPTREFDFIDLLKNFIGIAISGFLFLLVCFCIRNKHRKDR